MRAGFFSHEDRQAISWGAIIASLVVSVVLLFVGNAVFGRLERAVLKEI
jgi:ABC-2 type transport system permease protein